LDPCGLPFCGTDSTYIELLSINKYVDSWNS